jgi:hypothetical protein
MFGHLTHVHCVENWCSRGLALNFAAVSRGIYESTLRNLPIIFAKENSGPYFSVSVFGTASLNAMEYDSQPVVVT